jgi:hypothetical protein
MAEPRAEAPARLRAQQFELTRHLRDPQASPAPAGIEERRLAIYRDLLFNNIQGLLAGNFPVVSESLGERRWTALVRDFYREHRCRTPLFPELAREFLRYLEDRDELEPAFLLELAHYEWIELALQLSEAALDPAEFDADADLLDGVPLLSPLAWPLAYAWPVHRIGAQFQPEAPPPQPTLLLLRREADGEVRFSELSPLAWWYAWATRPNSAASSSCGRWPPRPAATIWTVSSPRAAPCSNRCAAAASCPARAPPAPPDRLPSAAAPAASAHPQPRCRTTTVPKAWPPAAAPDRPHRAHARPPRIGPAIGVC